MGVDAMVTNVVLRFDVDLKLTVRPRSRKSNQFILDNLEELRRRLSVERGRQTLSSQDRRCVK